MVINSIMAGEQKEWTYLGVKEGSIEVPYLTKKVIDGVVSLLLIKF